MSLKDLNIDRRWTLFLDRDGIVNRLREEDYVKCWEEFEFLPGVLEALPVLNRLFGRLIIATNQQGIGKGVMTAGAVEEVHRRMTDVIRTNGGEIHGVYYCPALESDHHPCRKPDTGMAYQARKDFPQIEFSRSVMAGDSPTDMEFGRRLGMVNVLIAGESCIKDLKKDAFDYYYPDLLSFTAEMKKYYL
jgi:histidinol-phosphate phosphatase family protein